MACVACFNLLSRPCSGSMLKINSYSNKIYRSKLIRFSYRTAAIPRGADGRLAGTFRPPTGFGAQCPDCTNCLERSLLSTMIRCTAGSSASPAYADLLLLNPGTNYLVRIFSTPSSRSFNQSIPAKSFPGLFLVNFFLPTFSSQTFFCQFSPSRPFDPSGSSSPARLRSALSARSFPTLSCPR